LAFGDAAFDEAAGLRFGVLFMEEQGHKASEENLSDKAPRKSPEAEGLLPGLRPCPSPYFRAFREKRDERKKESQLKKLLRVGAPQEKRRAPASKRRWIVIPEKSISCNEKDD